MRALDGALPVNVEYNLIDISYGSMESGAGACDNCGKLISNIATIENTETGKHHQVGCDCAEVLLSRCSYGAIMDLKQAKKEHNKKVTLIRKIKTHLKNDNSDVDIKDGWVTFYGRHCKGEWIDGEWIETGKSWWEWTSRYGLGYVQRVATELNYSLSEIKLKQGA